MKERALVGCLLGTAVGDALGLPYEGLSPRRGARLFPDTARHHFLFGRGMVSDDTEHACIVAQGLIRAGGSPEAFQGSLARSLRWWLLGLPAGVGWATLRSALRLWSGVRPSRSGVFSAGNGPAMRSPLLGVALGESTGALRAFVLKSTELTHTDPKAFYGALAVAVAARQSAFEPSISGTGFLEELAGCLGEDPADEFLSLAHRAARSAANGEEVAAFAQALGSRQGISGYVYHTVPCVLQAWLRHADDFAGGVREVISAGGDTDTTAAILGAILGARHGKEAIPDAWLSGVVDWPRGVGWMERLGRAVALAVGGGAATSPPYFTPGVVLRNAVFLAVVLAHGLRRLAPPY